MVFLITGTSLNFENTEKLSVGESKTLPKPAITYDWYNFTLPSELVPDVNINFTRDGSNVSFSMEDIINYAKYDNGTFELINYTIDKDGYHDIVGFNPIYLMELAGWYDVMNFTVNASDYSKQVNMTQLLFADGNFIKHPDTENETIIIIAWDGDWLANYDSGSYGDFYLWGENLAGNQKVRNINSIIYDDPWTVEFTLNGTTEAILNRNNATTSVTGNYTSYEWGYFDTDAGYGWDERECTGFTIASLLKHTSIGEQDYTLSFIAYDGYGENVQYTKEQIEQGFTGITINDPPVELLHQGRQAILMEISDDVPLGYARGPYQLITPGADKSNYIGGIVEIRIIIIPEENWIPGFQVQLLFIISIFAISALVMKSKKN
ncbi:hypothetical protein DSAG12_02463 [Promethearchaeum syntrophicum]|uniref:Uncharacterized protein n=1 Tax=Promethearchaeum syntrophicum TaxID=2594042 RepID=A0A5B9DCY5_9ARCH|nr:hypothetical protein [Candidatus Prometheoarchaeum syntrophicum]